MTWSDIPFQPPAKALRQFGAAWLIFFLALGAWQYFARQRPVLGAILMGLALVIGLLGLLRPAAVRWLFVGWMVLAFPIGWAISQLMLAVLFYGLLTPVALFFRWRGRDLLQRKAAPSATNFWLSKTTPSDVRNYFRQH